MCGVAGMWMKDPDASPSREGLERMADALSHRGPDGRGMFVDGPLGLVHTRLAIIDLESGHQPMSTSDGRVTIAYNGEIYNYRQERERLLGRGHRFRTRSDTEVILELYRERGEEFPERLRGMFALALWDREVRRLYLVRDRFGIKPLFLFEDSRCVAFASEAKALLALPFVPRDADPLAVKEYLTLQHTLGSRSMFRGIRKLEPARVLRLAQEGRVEREYWSLGYADRPGSSLGSASEAVRSALVEAVTVHLVSDVPVGSLLSGGLDTSAVVAVATAAYPGTLHTYTACTDPEPSNSDRFYADEVATRFGTAHHRVWLTAEGFAEAFPHVIWHLDEPGGGVPAVAAFYLAREARQHVRVILSGEGSDEAFGGYLHHLRAFAETRLAGAGGLPLRLLRALRLLPDLAAYRMELGGRRETAESLRAALFQERWWDAFHRPHFPQLARPPIGARLDAEASGYEPMREVSTRFITAARSAQPVNQLQWLDLRTYLVTILQIYDRMCMASSIESRVPFLDHPLVELAASFAPAERLRGLRTKQLLREAVTPLLPPAVLERRKSGFRLPVRDWFRGRLRDWVRDQLAERDVVEAGFVDPAAVRATVAAHEMGEDRSKELWSLLSLAAWHRTYLSAPRPVGPCECVGRPRPPLVHGGGTTMGGTNATTPAPVGPSSAPASPPGSRGRP